MTILSSLITGAVGLAGVFALAFAFARRIDNFSIVDVVWSYAFGAITILYAATGAGWLPRRLAIAAVVGIWSTRLGTHLARRVIAHHPAEDGRYVEMRRLWGADLLRRMFGFFQIQAASVVVLAVPFLLIAANTTARFGLVEIGGAMIWMIGVVGEAIADAQLARFKANPVHRGQVCDVGLWRLSRHPNYFFEWVIWVGYWAMACGSPWGVLTIVSPAIMLYLLLCVTGVPLSEEQSLRSRGEAYRRYQQTTSLFIPLPSRTR